MQILKKFIGNDQVDESKILFDNNQSFRADSAVSGELNLFKANTSDQLQFGVEVNAGAFKIRNMADPVSAQDAATKNYVDLLANGVSWKNAVLVATTANITLSGEQTIDGVLTSASRVLVKNQSAPAQNGIYISASGAWSRSSDMNLWSEVPAAAVFVQSGTANADIGYVCTSQPGGTLGTTAISFVQFSSSGAYTADGVTLQLISGQFSIKNGGVSDAQVNAAAGIQYSKLNLSNSIVNADINSAAAIAFSKLASLSSGNILVGSVGNVATSVSLSGDASLVASGALTLASTGVSAGSYGSSTSIPSFTVDAKGRLTAASGNAVIAPAGTLTGTTLASNVVSSSLTSVGTITSGTWNGTNVAIAHGGTGQSTKSAGFDALSPLSTKGDLLGYSTTNDRLPVGTDAYVLTADSTQTLGVKWAPSPSTPAAGPSGSVQFSDGSGGFLADNTAFSWDDTAFSLSINGGDGNLTPALQLSASTNRGAVQITNPNNGEFACFGINQFGNQIANGSDTGDFVIRTGGSNSKICLAPTATSALLLDGTALTATFGVGYAEVLSGSTSGFFSQLANPVTTDYSVIWPAAQSSANQLLSNDGAGNLSWTSPAASVTNAKELIVLSPTDITNQYAQLSNLPLTDSVDFLVKGGGVQIEGASYDYTVDYANNRIIFQNDLATGGPSALVSGDVVVVKYQY